MPEWTFITNHGLVLAYIAKHSQSTAREIALAINLTERTILKIIADLEAEGYIERQRVGRNNVYGIRSHLGLRHETTVGTEVGDLLRVLGWKRRKSLSKARSNQ
jgi:DNA-binding Lrp family transcriptional regulator